MSNKILYSREEIKSFTVKDLKEEFKSNLPIDSDAFLFSKTYSLVVSIVQTILKKGWTQIEFREYKEKEITGQYLGSEQVWSGTLAAVSEVYVRYVTPNNNKRFTTNGLEELILKYPEEDKIEKHLIKELYINCRRAIVSVYKESATRQISDNVYNRVVDVASELPFVYNTRDKTIKLSGYKCKKEDSYVNLRAAISSATLQYGTNYALETEEIRGDKINVRHILITPPTTEADESKAYKKAQALKDSSLTLNSFIEKVKKHSKDEETRESGGNLGWINPKTYPIPEFGMILNQIESGVCAGPVRTDLGYHLVWLEAFKPGGRANLSKHWTEIESMALNQKQSKWFEMWIEKSKKNVYISINN